MTKKLSVGNQDFEDIIVNNNFYVDKTKFIEEWWGNNDKVTLITRPRRFGKTLMMSTVKCFFSLRYKGRKELFDGLHISQNQDMMDLQGTIPVIALSFAEAKKLKESMADITEYQTMVLRLKKKISTLFDGFRYAFDSNGLSDDEKRDCNIICKNDPKKFTDLLFTESIQLLCRVLIKFHGVKPIIVLDEYDTPLQVAYARGYWQDLVSLMSSLFNTSFKTQNYYQRVLITGITRVSKESLFSDVNNFKTFSVTSNQYADCFGFTEQEVFAALDEYGMSGEKENVKEWYDGFVFGNLKEIYNPYSIASLLDEREFKTYWADTASNTLVSRLIQNGPDGTRDDFLQLMKGEAIKCLINENVVYGTLDQEASAIWSLLLGSGYLKADDVLRRGKDNKPLKRPVYTLSITNLETQIMLEDMVTKWFTAGKNARSYERFIEALLAYSVRDMNVFLNEVSLSSFSYFCTDNTSPESFWQGFIVGLLVTLRDDYILTANRIAGYGIYDIQLKPRDKSLQAFVIEIKKIEDAKKDALESDAPLVAGVREALKQIEDNKYYTELVAEGYPIIRKLGLAFRGQKCLIGDAQSIKGKTGTKRTNTRTKGKKAQA